MYFFAFCVFVGEVTKDYVLVLPPVLQQVLTA